MGRRKGDTPQKAALRQLMQGYLKDNDISVKNGTDVNAIMRDMMSVILEGAPDEELNEELGYPSERLPLSVELPRKHCPPWYQRGERKS